MTGLPRLTITAAIAVLLTALSLQPTLQDSSWLIPTILCVAVVAGTGYVARRLRVPRLLVPVLELAALGVLLVLRFVQDNAVWGFLPGRDVALDVRALLDEGFGTISNYAPPAPVTPGLTFLLAGSIALVAVIVDTIAVTYRSPALAGLPLLVLYAVPVSVVNHGVSWVYFGVAATGWLALLLADGRERLGGWGRRLGTRTFAGDPTANDVPVVAEPLGAVGRRIGVASVAMAVLLPAIIPGLSEAVFGRGLGNGTGDGGGTVNTINPFVSLGADLNRVDNSEVLHYSTTAADPDYLRMVTLDTFDGLNWVPASLKTSGHVASDTMPTPPGLDSTVRQIPQSTTITLTGLKSTTWLPAAYPMTKLSVDGDNSSRWVWDTENRVVWSANDRTEDLTYTVDSLDVLPTQTELRTAGSVDPDLVGTYTDIPSGARAAVEATARRVVAGATSEYEQAVLLQNFFRTGFVYDTAQAQDKQDPLGSFLRNKRGFCQQFAGTYAAMARTLGLPTRVVVGFVPGAKQPDGSFSVTFHDYHAWPEVYFENVGWVRFEPTPSTNVGVSVPNYSQAGGGPDLPDRQQPDPTASESSGAAPSASSNIPRGVVDGDRGNKEGTAPTGLRSFPWVWVLVPLLVVGVLLLPWAVRLRQRRARYAVADGSDPREAAAAAWAELAATAADLDLAWPASRTPRQVALALIESTQLERGDATVGPPAADALRRLALTTERARYARTAQATPGLVADVTAARKGLLAWASRLQRLRARFAPVSMLSRVGARTADTLDWVDTAPRRARRAMGSRRNKQQEREHSTTSS